MKKLFQQSPGLVSGLFLFSLALVGYAVSLRASHDLSERQIKELIAPPQELKYLHFGHQYLMSDLFWIRAIQDFDYCESPIGKNLCRGNSWLSQTLDLVVTLDPDFRMAYSAGGMALSVVISDIQGASRLFDRGLNAFPQDWILHYKAAYHSLYEEKDPEKAAQRMQIAAKLGAPDWVYALAGRLYTEAGKKELAAKVLEEATALGLSEKILNRIREKMQGDSP